MLHIFLVYCVLTKCVSPWYNCTGWLGKKHQVTSYVCASVLCCFHNLFLNILETLQRVLTAWDLQGWFQWTHAEIRNAPSVIAEFGGRVWRKGAGKWGFMWSPWRERKFSRFSIFSIYVQDTDIKSYETQASSAQPPSVTLLFCWYSRVCNCPFLVKILLCCWQVQLLSSCSHS